MEAVNVAERDTAMQRILFSLISVAVTTLATFALPAAADANTPITHFSAAPSSTQAGGHPDIKAIVDVENTNLQYPDQRPPGDCQCHDAKTIIIDAPAGAVPNASAGGHCSASDFGENRCPIDAQIGVVYLNLVGEVGGTKSTFTAIPVYNLVPHPGQAGLAGFFVPLLASPVFTVIEGRTESDYGLEFAVTGISHFLGGLTGIEQIIWGVPADPKNDALRIHPRGCEPYEIAFHPCEGGTPSNLPLEPFIDAPTMCGAPLESALRVESYDLEVTTANSPYPATTGCDQLSFNPSLFAQPTTRRTDTPSGIDVDLKVPPAESPVAPTPSHIKGVSVSFPEGFSINPNAADGKTSCSAEEARLGIRHEAAQCPESSKVGSLTLESSALPGPMPGYIYLADPEPGNPYRIWLIADGFGQHVKLGPGSAQADPITGKLTVSFPDLPQFPFNDFRMHFFGSERGLLATPKSCGTFAVNSTFTPWDAALPVQESTQYFQLDEGTDGASCPALPRSFSPSVTAGVADKGAGKHAPFTFQVSRPDGDQNLSKITVKTPPGFSATLKGIPYCPEAAIAKLGAPAYKGQEEQASSACPAASQVGTATAGVGAGTHPLYVGGRVYLAGPYKGAPLSLETVIPALSGPYDLGVVAVRTALNVDTESAQVTAVSDPLPQILGGVPFRTRSIRLSLDRDGFALNPTNCDPFSVESTISGDEGAAAGRSTHFQVANCRDLDFGPKLSLRLSGNMRRTGHPAVHAVLTAKPGEANISRTAVTLFRGEQIDNAHINSPCTRKQFAVNACPPQSVIGSASAVSPLLGQSLEGPVYLMTGFGHKLPDIVADLRGQIHVVLDGRVDTVHSRLRTTFESVPDVPVTKFVLNLAGNKKGLLISSKNICKLDAKANVNMTGQNGAHANTVMPLGTSCDSKAKRKRHRRHAHRAGKAD
jgi:hypothetical protein